MLEEAYCLGLDQADDHVAQDGPDSIEPLIGSTDVA